MSFFKKFKATTVNTDSSSVTAKKTDSSKTQLNDNDTAQDNNSTTIDNNEEKPFRLVPGGKIPNQGKVLLIQFASLLFMLSIQVGIPLALYYGLRNKIGVVYALVISGIPPFLWVIVEFIRKRKVDMLGCIIGGSFVISGAISIASGDERAALIRDSAVAAVVGFFFLLSLIPLNTKWLVIQPLTYIMSQQMLSKVFYEWTDREGNPQKQNIIVWQWEHIRYFRWSMRIQSALWGFVLNMQLVACILFVYVTDLSVDDIVKYNNIISSVYTPVMISISIAAGIIGVRFEKRIGKKWVEENDFTEKFEAERQQQEQQHQEGEGKDNTRSGIEDDSEEEHQRRIANVV